VAWVQKRRKHVRMDLIFNQLNPKVQCIVGLFTSIISIIICFILTIYGAKVTLYFLKTGYPTPTPLRIPKFILILIIFWGSLLLLIQFLRTTYEQWLELKRK
jgi:TRAP-type C4-dicarboxylate transport system permease small subunit